MKTTKTFRLLAVLLALLLGLSGLCAAAESAVPLENLTIDQYNEWLQQTQDSNSPAADYLAQIAALTEQFEALDPEAEDYAEKLEEINSQMGLITEDATNAFMEGELTEEEYLAIYAALEELNTKIGGPEQGEALINFQMHCIAKNAEVAWLVFDGNTDTSNLQLTPISNGEYAEIVSTNSDMRGKIAIFFVKPSDGALLTKMTLGPNNNGQNGSVDLYGTSVKATESAFFQGKTSTVQSVGQAIIDYAVKNGYIGYFGYTINNISVTKHYLTIEGEKPGITVTAVANPSTGIRPGSVINYVVTITPDKTNAKDADIIGAMLTELKINNETIDVSSLELMKNTDGTYSLAIPHTVTLQEWQNEIADISVTAQLEYSYVIPVTDTSKLGSNVISNVKVTASDATECKFEAAKGVTYEFRYAGSEGLSNIPDSIKTPPVDTEAYWKGDKITIMGHGAGDDVVDDPANGGTWTFDGWYVDGDGAKYSADDILTMGDSNILLVGTWTFTSYPLGDLTIKKDGWNKADSHQSFVFTVKGTDNNTNSIELEVVVHEDGEVTIKDLPVGKYTITENTAWSWRYKPDEKTQEKMVVGKDTVTVTFNNNREETKWLDGNTYCDNRWINKQKVEPEN